MNRLKTISSSVIVVFLVALQSGCTGVPDGAQVVSDFEVDRYLGKWYEVARLDHSFERGLSNVTATYSMRDDGGLRVLNRGFDVKTSKWDEAEGKAYFVDDTNTGQLKVSFFGPFYGGYNILELDKEDYQFALVAGPNRSYLWVLSRAPQLDAEILSDLISKAENLGFATSELIYVDHTMVN